MRVFARRELACHAACDGRPALLLEGSWPVSTEDHWSLDDAIDARHGWIDNAAAQYAEAIGPPPTADDGHASFAYLNALSLRYYLVKLLRVVAFFEDVRPAGPGEAVESHLHAGRDEDYAALLRQIAGSRGFDLRIDWHEAPSQPVRSPPRGVSWRRWAARAQVRASAARRARADAPRIVLCGNPSLLDGVCRRLVERGCRVWWLYERFAARSWWRWRRYGVGQLNCDFGDARPRRFSDGSAATDVICRGINLSPALDVGLARKAAELGGRQSQWLEQIDRHFRSLRPTRLVLDEDATPLKRAALAIARRWGAPSSVVQHGAPCGPFGFAPLAADEICVWGESTRSQLVNWGVVDERIHITGWPSVERRWRRWNDLAQRRRDRAAPTFLLLATVPPSDSRPDMVTFHLTRHTHEALVEMACAAVSKFAGARMIVKLHPRSQSAADFRRVLASYPPLRYRLARAADLDSLFAECDCVLSCASTAGIEAALAGLPVVQLLPAGSGNVLPCEDWGLFGTARDARELDTLLTAALARSWPVRPRWDPNVVGDGQHPAVDRIVDGITGPLSMNEDVRSQK
jgi:hypothetical protein